MTTKTRTQRGRGRVRKAPPRPSTGPETGTKSPTSSPAPARTIRRPSILPHLLTADELADLLRTTRKAIYAAVSRGQLPGVVRLQRRVLFDEAEVVSWLSKRRAKSLEGHQR